VIGGLWRRIVELVRPGRLDREVVEELAHHVELLVARKVATGMAEPEARRQATIEVGSIGEARQTIAEGRTGFVLDQLAREIRYAARVLRRSPGVTILSIGTMGLGIGVSATLFTLVDCIALRPLPYPEPDRLVRIFDTNRESGVRRTGVASGNLADWRLRAAAFSGIAGYYAMGRTLSVDGQADVLITANVSRDFFDVAGVRPLVGRPFTEEETRAATFTVANAPTGADPVVILSYRLWQQRFGGDPSVIGRLVSLERRSFKIVGVMPERFDLPEPGVQLWIPWRLAPDDPRDQHYLGAIGRLKPGISMARAEGELGAVAAELAEEYPKTNRGFGVELSPLASETIGGAAAVLWMLLGAVGLVLLVACANVALLSLLRGFDRQEEIGVRLALGASSGRLLRELLLESLLLAGAGGVIGVIVAAVALRLLPALAADLPRLDEVALDGRALVFLVAITSLAALLSGLPQAWRRTRIAPVAGLAVGALRATEGVERHRLRDAIVVIQVAMAVILMTGSGLLVRSFRALERSDPGFDPRRVLVVPVFLDAQEYGSGAKSRAYYRTLFEKLAAVPGVVAVGGATTVPTSPLGPDFERPVWAEGSAPDEAHRAPAAVRMVTPGYFRVMGIPIVAGRPFDDRDSPEAPRVLMVSQTLAKRIWPAESAVGKRLVVDYSGSGTYPYEVVGVVSDLRFRGPRSEPLPEIYLPHAQRSYLVLNVVMKTAGDPRILIPSVRAVLRSVDPEKPAQGLYPLETLVRDTYARDRQAMVTLVVFGTTAVFLAVLSVYGVLSQRVRERSREIAIRVAMGANAPTVMGWVAGSGFRLIALGLAGGMLVARWLSGVLEGMLYGVRPTDLLTGIGVAVGLALVGLVATLVPAWRAARIDPVSVLRRG
jgi:putative ABC transport system permease protein